MFDAQPTAVRVGIDVTSSEVDALRAYQPFAVAHAMNAGLGNAPFLVRGAFTPGSEAVVSNADCLALPKDVDPMRAILALPLASMLAVWESASLELGQVALWTGGSTLSSLAGQVAIWRGACPGVQLGPAADASHQPIDGCEYVDWSDSEAALQRLTALCQGVPGCVAVDLSGRADVIDTLLEVVPSFGSLVLAGPVGEKVTIDFYKNIHRKGVVVRTMVLEPVDAFDRHAGAAFVAQLPRALEILRNPAMAGRCEALLGKRAARPMVVAG